MRAIEKLQKRIEQLEKDKKSLMNRCFVQSRGLLCIFCEFEEECDHRNGTTRSNRSNNRNARGCVY